MKPAFSLGAPARPSPFAALAAAITAGVAQFPEGRFLGLARDGSRQECPYPQMLKQAHSILAGLQAQGAQPGDMLAVLLDGALAVTATLWAGVLGGLVLAPLGPQTTAARGAQLTALRDVAPRLHVVARGAERPDGALDFDQLLAAHGPATLAAASAPTDLRFVITTSGTTGRPRLVGLSDAAALARWWPELPAAGQARGFLSWSSFQHVMGIGHIMPNLLLKVHLDADHFGLQPLAWLDLLASSGATHATMTNFGMSLVLRALAQHPERRWDLAHVRRIGVGAEAISAPTAGAFLVALQGFGLPRDALILGYGLSECGPVVGGGLPFIPDSAAADADGIALDRPTRGHAVRIIGDNGYMTHEGVIGQIEVRGPTMTSGYLGDAAGTAALFTADGWLRTGDLGLLRDGKLTVSGREKELVVINARKLTCHEIEAAITQRTGLTEVYASPLPADPAPSPEGSANPSPGAPCAVFVCPPADETATIDQVAQMVREATAAAFRFAPRVVALLPPDQVPRTALGKVRRLALPALLPALVETTSQLQAAPASDVPAPDAPAAGVEARLSALWRDLLQLEGPLDRDADFFALGGDSLLALRLSLMIEEAFKVSVAVARLQTRLSLATLTELLTESGAADGVALAPSPSTDDPWPTWADTRLRGFLADWPGTPARPGGYLRKLGAGTEGVPLFWCLQHAEEADCLARDLGQRLPVYGMRSGMTLMDYPSALASALTVRYVQEITAICPEGPLMLAGICQGFNIALAATRQLVEVGRDVRLLIATDCRFAEICGTLPVPVPVALMAATASKFNPYRLFHQPEKGLQRLAPKGLRLGTIETSYAKMMLDPAMAELGREVTAAIAWAAAAATPPSPPRPALIYQRRLSSPLKRLELPAGGDFALPVRLKNTSDVFWDAFAGSGLALGNHWLTAAGRMVVWSDGRTPLPRPLEPGGRAYLVLGITAPAQPGAYLLEVDLVEEGICWFADFALAPLHIPVTVTARAGLRARPRLLPAIFGWADRVPLLTRARPRK